MCDSQKGKEKSTRRLSISPIKRGWTIIGIQMLVMVFLTALLDFFDLDRRVADVFYHSESGWYLAKSPFWFWLYQYGTIPGLVLTVAALIGYAMGFFKKNFKSWQQPCLVVVLTTILSAGLLVNAVLKQYWGRPRPDQTIEYGGKWQYRAVFPPGTPGKGASFPCGHCTMGFVFFSLGAFYRRNKVLAVSGIAAGMVLGGLLSAARIVQGAHFLSDTLWSMGLVVMTVTGLCIHLIKKATVRPKNMNKRQRVWITLAFIAVMLMMIGGFLTRRPYFNTMVYPLKLTSSLKSIRIHMNVDPERVSISYGKENKAYLQVDAHGFGWLRFDYHMKFNSQLKSGDLHIFLKADVHSYFAELNHAVLLNLSDNTWPGMTVWVNSQLIESSRS